MSPKTAATLNALRDIQWFNRVGVHDTNSAEVLASWDGAIESCSSIEWENLCLEAVNQYCDKLLKKNPIRYQEWNEIVSEIKPITQALVQDKTKDVVVENKLPKVFVDAVNWDVLHLCMEAEYADVYPPGFYASQAYWYTKGHFPCGWRGEFPTGNLVIF